MPADRLVAAGTEFADVAGGSGRRTADDPGRRRRAAAPVPPEAVAAGSSASVPLLIGTTRDESAFFALGQPEARCPRRWTDCAAGCAGSPRTRRRPTAVIATVRAARAGAGRVGRAPRPVVGHRHRVRVPGGHRPVRRRPRRAPPIPGSAPTPTCSPGSRRHSTVCSARATPSRSPSCSGRCKNPVVQAFSGGGEDAFALSAPCAGPGPRSPAPGCPLRAARCRDGDVGAWDPDRPSDDGARPVARCRGPGPPGRRPAGRGARRGRLGHSHQRPATGRTDGDHVEWLRQRPAVVSGIYSRSEWGRRRFRGT